MPATQNYRLADWHESPFLSGTHSLEVVPDSRVFNPDNVNDVALCLMETDPVIEAHRWVLSDKQLEGLALESATEIVRNRRQLKLESDLTNRFETAKQRRGKRADGERMAVVVSLVQNLETGETTISDTQVPISRFKA